MVGIGVIDNIDGDNDNDGGGGAGGSGGGGGDNDDDDEIDGSDGSDGFRANEVVTFVRNGTSLFDGGPCVGFGINGITFGCKSSAGTVFKVSFFASSNSVNMVHGLQCSWKFTLCANANFKNTQTQFSTFNLICSNWTR